MGLVNYLKDAWYSERGDCCTSTTVDNNRVFCGGGGRKYALKNKFLNNLIICKILTFFTHLFLSRYSYNLF